MKMIIKKLLANAGVLICRPLFSVDWQGISGSLDVKNRKSVLRRILECKESSLVFP